MDFISTNRFLRIPNALFDALLKLDLTAVAWRIVLWTVRNTIGWNRDATTFSWYRIAKELSLDRAGVARTGKALIRMNLLFIRDDALGIQKDASAWDGQLSHRPCDDVRQLWLMDVVADGNHRTPMTDVTGDEDEHHEKRCQQSSPFRRVKYSSKDSLKTYKDKTARERNEAQRRAKAPTDKSERQLLAGAAKPVAGKYDSVSQN